MTETPSGEERDPSMLAPAPPEVGSGTDALVTMTTRVRESTHRSVKALAAQRGQKVQDIVEQALREYLARNS